MFFYKQVLEFHCPSKLLCQTSGRQNHWSLLLTQMSPLAGKPFQAIATMTYTRWHTLPSQKDLGCMGAPSFLHGFICLRPPPLVWPHGWRKLGIIHRGGGSYLRCPVFTSVHFSLRNEGSSVYIHVCEGRERAWARILKLLTSGINFGIFSQKNHHAKDYCFITSTPTIVDSILCIFSIPGIGFSPLYTPTEILPLENFVC